MNDSNQEVSLVGVGRGSFLKLRNALIFLQTIEERERGERLSQNFIQEFFFSSIKT